MRVARWGKSLAIRLSRTVVEALELKEGEEVELHLLDERGFAVGRKPEKKELLSAAAGLSRSIAGRLQVRSP